MLFQIRTTRRADNDIDSTVQSLIVHVSANAAQRRHTGLVAAVHTLASRPERCPQADEAADLGIELRHLLYGRRPHVYRILFTIDGDAVNILRVRHAARDRLNDGDVRRD